MPNTLTQNPLQLNTLYRILEQSSDFCCVADPGGMLMWGNSRFYALCSIDIALNASTTLADALQLSAAEQINETLKAAAADQTEQKMTCYSGVIDDEISLAFTPAGEDIVVTIAAKYDTRRSNKASVMEHPGQGGSNQNGKLHESLLEQAPVSMLMLNDKLQIILASDVWLGRYNLIREETIGKTLPEIFHQLPDRLMELFQNCLLSGGSYGSENEEMQLMDGSLQNLRWNIKPWFNEDGSVGGIMVISDIITENVKREQQYVRLLREFELLCVVEDTVMVASDEFSMLENVCKKIIEYGQFELAWIGYAPDPINESQLINATHKFGTAIHYLDDFYIDLNKPEHRNGPTATALRTGKNVVVNNMQSSPSFSPWLMMAEHYNLHSSISLPMCLSTGQWLVMAIYSDENDSFTNDEVIILERLARTVNFALDNIQSKYENKVAELKQNKLINDLNLRNRSLEEFSHVVSHNLRAKVADLMGISSLLKDNRDLLPPTELNELMTAIGRTSAKLDEVMRDLNSTLLVKTNVLLNQEQVDLTRLISEIKQKLTFEHPDRKINVSTDFSEINYFWSCRYYLFEVILHLMHSMVKYSADINEVNVAIASATKDKTITISITDDLTGTNLNGIENNILDVYKKLYQHLTGGGIKLFYARAIAETLGGQLTVENDKKSKIIFNISLPLGFDNFVN